ncbi:outer membrane protein assembly complex protein YaeT [Taylorella asinigenitalis 14/45]|uniref:Outer membrane protein assembly factor BamA n=1 Tax=Taylorella asinigenitalis 14/45 TaxID=1091495 RepID=I7JL99_9BURK|nr:outer membrane protein assembly factor BamA [Taylorella asinigenitalis]CCG18902.1 outer membrane protein assembly complex protein YaeT [Taylorella asinigenitalis 14/45]
MSSSSEKKQIKFASILSGFVLTALTSFSSVYAQFQPFKVKDIIVTGLQNTEAIAVFGFIPARVNSTFTPAVASDTIKRMHSTGLFEDIKVTHKNGIVYINVVERPVIASVIFDGMNIFDPKQITQSLSDLGFGEGRPLNPSLLNKAVGEIRNQYVNVGNYSVDIKQIFTPLPNNRVGVNFQIKEGRKSKIRDINFVGNSEISSSRLRSQMNLTTPGFMTWYTGTDKFSREKLANDVEILRDYYMDRGYLDVRIDPPQVNISPNLEDIGINFTVSEGKPYKIRNIKLSGYTMGLNDEILDRVINREGRTFKISEARASVNDIKLYLGSLGYALAEVNPIPTPISGTQEVDLTFFINPGKRMYVRRINIGGNTRTRDEVIRREIRQDEGAWYDAERLGLSVNRINRLGYFNDVVMTQAPVQGTDDQVDVNIDVKEKPTGLINVGVGYGSTDKLSFQAGISQDNIFGSGTNLAVSFNTAKTNRNLSIVHTDPYWTSSGISRTTSLYYRLDKPYSNAVNQEKDTYQVRGLGLNMNFGVPISEYDRIFLGLGFERNETILPSVESGFLIPAAYRDFVKEYGEKNNSFTLSLGWSKDTRDNAIAPTKGYLTSLSVLASFGDLKYYKLSAQQQYYLPLSKDYILAFNLAADWGRTYGSAKKYPVIKNVFAGGIGSVRGYEGASLGPRDVLTGDYLGGNTKIVGNIQLYLPFPGTQNDRSLRWFLFADAGKVGVTGGDMKCSAGNPSYGGVVDDPCGWRYSAGVGLSWQSPIGPLQISYAYPLKSKEGDKKQSFQFQIGASF